jgi:hypothetical protein
MCKCVNVMFPSENHFSRRRLHDGGCNSLAQKYWIKGRTHNGGPA